jgi:hypothetical protein
MDTSMTKDEAMKQALEALEAVKKTYDEQNFVSLGTNTAIIDLRQAIAEAEKQEPVGMFAKFSSGVWKEVTDGSAGQPLYAYPPKREWQGLTDEEKEECKMKSLDGTGWSLDVDLDYYAAHIEAKLKEKNT